jgi:mono/diheme cytochrome c family protein
VLQPAIPNRPKNVRTFALIALFESLGFGPLTSASAQAAGAPVTIWDGAYSEAQARRGEQVFNTQCSYCHKESLSGGFFDGGLDRAAALAGKRAFDSSVNGDARP